MLHSKYDTSTAQPRSQHLTVAAHRVLEPVLLAIDHPQIRDILLQVRAGKGEIWIDYGSRLKKIPGWSCGSTALHRFACAVIRAGGRHLDENTPVADVQLGAGIRVHAVISPVSVFGAAASIRVPSSASLSFETLVGQHDLCEPDVAHQVQKALLLRRNLLITGGTGTGKTTLLSALFNQVNPAERIITIEDVAELRLTHPNHIALESRQSNTEGIGEIPLSDLLRATLRMRPDRIVLGECRGAEIVTLLNALNTGHDGGAATLHANSISGVAARLEALGALGGLSAEALAKQVVSAIHMVVHLVRDKRGRHRIAQLGAPTLVKNTLTIQPL